MGGSHFSFLHGLKSRFAILKHNDAIGISNMCPVSLFLAVQEQKKDVGDMLFTAASYFVCKFNSGKFLSAFQ
ncbi:UNVERIFIED_CONTAM: hypothetical protein NCL1_46685 [Trichonephila clavipes]